MGVKQDFVNGKRVGIFLALSTQLPGRAGLLIEV